MIGLQNLVFFRTAPEQVRKWWRDGAANRRARVLLVALGFTLAASGLLILDSRDGEIRREAADKQAQLFRIGQVGQAELWQRHREEAQLARNQAKARLWEAETDGLAQANFQSWLLDQAKQAGIAVGEMRSSIDANPNNPLKLRRVSAQVSGRFEAAGFVKLLQAIAGQERLVVIERLDIHIAPMPRFEMVLGAFLRPAAKA
jgi:Type II secretion system (T2SS), protein M subtype b